LCILAECAACINWRELLSGEIGEVKDRLDRAEWTFEEVGSVGFEQSVTCMRKSC